MSIDQMSCTNGNLASFTPKITRQNEVNPSPSFATTLLCYLEQIIETLLTFFPSNGILNKVEYF
jgi:hypothetical protein